MNTIAKVISLLALAMTIVPCLLYFCGLVGHSTVTSFALMGTVAWFLATPVWMERELAVDASEVEI